MISLIAVVVTLAQAEGDPSQTRDRAPSDSTDALVSKELLVTRGVSITGYPYAYYTPETELAFGAGGIATFYTSRSSVLRPSKLTLSGYYSTRKQYSVSLGSTAFFARNRVLATGAIGFGQFVDKFWGIGNDTPDTGNEDYVTNVWSISLQGQVPALFAGKWRRVGLVYAFSSDDIVDKEDNIFLQTDSVTGSNGGITSGLGVIMSYDTRDSVFYPTMGGWYQGQAIFFGSGLGSDFTYETYSLDLRQYVAVGGEHILAIQGLMRLARGNPPFYEYPALGGSQIMRGYFYGRFRDLNYLAGQVEYRTHIWWKIGGVVFGGLGNVGSDDQPMTIDTTKWSVGGGLRFLFDAEQHINLRADLGVGDGSTGVYFGMEEAF